MNGPEVKIMIFDFLKKCRLKVTFLWIFLGNLFFYLIKLYR